jgi:hypothetical protein
VKIYKKVLLVVLLISTAVGAVLSVNNAQNIIDWWRLRDYTPTAKIEAVADRTSMSEHGKKLFYVHDPELLNKDNFQTSCTVGESTIVLGCYISNQRIYLYEVEEARLDGVVEVTAAHEMLHAGYDRLELKEKDRVDKLLLEAYDRIENSRLREIIESYRQRDPSVVSNELHSILGTEYRDLPRDLEDHYSKYFVDRLSVVALAEAYAEEFEKREAQIEDFDKQLNELNGEITRIQAELTLQNTALQNDRTKIESYRSDPDKYNSAVTVYNRNVGTYNNGVAKVKTLIEQYNNLVVERNKIAVEERELVEAIDTRESEL